MAYTDATLLANFLQRTLTASETGILPTLIPAVKLWIDHKVDSTFDTVAETTRYFEGGYKSLDIDRCQAITQIQSLDPYNISYYTYQTFEYVTEPANETIKNEIRLRFGHFPKGTENIGVTALFTEYDFANSKVPDDIQVAATRLCAGIINAGKFAGQGEFLHREALEGHMVQYDITGMAIKAIAESDPILQAILTARTEPLLW